LSILLISELFCNTLIREYGDVTATYIRRVKIPLRNQYTQESVCESIVVIYIPTEKYKYIVITESDIILQEYYITREYKSMIYKEICITKIERCSRAARGASKFEKGF